jgi:hypothetical protein
MSELEPTPELPDDTPIREVRFPTRMKDALFAAGLKTVGEVRETSDKALLALAFRSSVDRHRGGGWSQRHQDKNVLGCFTHYWRYG